MQTDHYLLLLLLSPYFRFIENNKIETTSKYSFRGLRDLTHLYVLL